jgi:hypothetical protein
MERPIRNNLFFSFKSKSLLTLFLSGLAFQAHAEYYVVYPGTPVTYPAINCDHGYRKNHCGRCRGDTCCYPISDAYYKFRTYESYKPYGPIEYIYSSAPRRRAVHTGSGEVAEFAWIPPQEYPTYRAPKRRECIDP